MNYWKSLWFCMFFLVTFSGFGQRIITTNSGQYIEMKNDGTFVTLENVDTLNLVNLSPFEVPRSQSTNIEIDEKILTNDLLHNLQLKEATMAVQAQLILEKSVLKSADVDQAIAVGNSYLQDSFTRQLKLFQEESLVINESYLSISEDIDRLNNMSQKLDIAERQRIFNEISTKHTLEVKMFESFNPSITKQTSLRPDERKPWDISDDCKGVHRTVYENRVNMSTGLDLILTYTPQRLDRHYVGLDYLTCNGGLVKIDGKYYIDLEVRFQSKDAKKGYGLINKNSFLRIELISGKRIFLNAMATSEGKLENYSGNTVYNIRYEFGNDFDLRSLKRNYVDNLGILWSSGFENYPVYKIDFFKTKFDCLENEY